MGTPLVSFVIPVWNSERDIARCLLAIRQVRCPAGTYEVIILDNGSTDKTPEIMHTLGFPFQVVPHVNVSTLRNRGVALAQGEYVAFVDSDVEIAPEWLEYGLPHFAVPQVVACGCFPGVPPDATWVQKTWDLHQRGRQALTAPVVVPWLPSMNLLVRRDVFQAVSGFNEALVTAEDVDLCYRLGQHGQIVSESRMAAIHWGEAPDVRTFWRKEVWRGLGNLHGVRSHGWRWDELPSLGYPLYMLGLGLVFLLGCLLDSWSQQVSLAPLLLLVWMLPALLLACHTAYRARRGVALPQLWVLYALYGLARAYAVSQHWGSARRRV